MMRVLGLGLAVLVGAAGQVCGETAPAARLANARELVRIAAESCAGAARALEGRSDLQSARVQPLRASLKDMSATLDAVGSKLQMRDLQFFRALRAGTRTLAAVQVNLSRSGLQDAGLQNDLQMLDAVYGRLRNRYGKEWLRFRTGQPLNDEEKRRFEAMRTEEALLAGRLAPLQEKAQAAGDHDTASELALLINQAQAIAQAPPTLDEMLNASVLRDTMEGEYAAARDANPADDPAWNDADQAVENVSTDGSVGYLFSADLSSGQQWAYTETATTLPEGIASGALDEALAVRPAANRQAAAADLPVAEEEEMAEEGTGEVFEEAPGDEEAAAASRTGEAAEPEAGEIEEAGETGTASPAVVEIPAAQTPESADTECTADSAKDCSGSLFKEAPAAAVSSPAPSNKPPIG